HFVTLTACPLSSRVPETACRVTAESPAPGRDAWRRELVVYYDLIYGRILPGSGMSRPAPGEGRTMRYTGRITGGLAALLLAIYGVLGVPATASGAPAPAPGPGSGSQASPWGHGQGPGQTAPPKYQPHDTITRISGRHYH